MWNELNFIPLENICIILIMITSDETGVGTLIFEGKSWQGEDDRMWTNDSTSTLLDQSRSGPSKFSPIQSE
jgi:hypothetical protein